MKEMNQVKEADAERDLKVIGAVTGRTSSAEPNIKETGAEVRFPSLAKLYDHLYEMKCRGAFGCEAYAELSRDYGYGNRGFVGKGQTVRIVMVSRMGDVGWTPSLDTETGYECRTAFDSDLLVNCRLER